MRFITLKNGSGIRCNSIIAVRVAKADSCGNKDRVIVDYGSGAYVNSIILPLETEEEAVSLAASIMASITDGELNMDTILREARNSVRTDSSDDALDKLVEHCKEQAGQDGFTLDADAFHDMLRIRRYDLMEEAEGAASESNQPNKPGDFSNPN